MALSEAEEFELLSLEREKSLGGNPSPLQSKNPIGATQQEPAFEREAREIRDTTPAELVSANPIVRALTSAAEPILGSTALLASKMGDQGGMESMRDLKEMQRKGAQALGFTKGETMAQDIGGGVVGPVSVAALKAPAAASAAGRIAQGTGFGALSGLTSDPEKPLSSGGVGGVAGAGITAAIEGLLKTPGAVGKLVSAIGPMLGFGTSKAAPKAPTTAGAEKAVGELQAQRDVMAGAPAREGKAASEFERASTDFENRMQPLKEEAFRGSPINVRSATDLIAKLETKNPDAKVRAALSEAKGTIDRALESSKSAALPAQGSRMTVEQLRASQSQGSNLSVEMADEVRQSINRQINQKGDNALDAHTKDVLAQVRDNIVGKTSKEYQSYLKQFSDGKTALDKYAPEVSVVGKVTTDRRGAARLAGTDAQNAIESVFTGMTPERDIRQLVESVKQNPEALNGARESFRKWVMPTDAAGKVNVDQAAKRWTQAKDAVEKSGLFEPNHYAAIDKVAMDLAARAEATSGLKTAAGAVGSLLSYKTAVGARTVAGWIARSSDKTPQQVEGLIQKAMQDVEFARLAAASPTQQNIMAVERAMGAAAGERAAEPTAPRRKRNPLSMQPAGL